MTTEGVENFQAIVTSLAAVAAAFVAWMGLSTWKSQIVWSADREVARTALKQLRNLEKQIRISRNPRFLTNELSETRLRHDYLQEFKIDEWSVLEQAHRDRLTKIADIIEDCELTFDECYALWDKLLETDWQQARRILLEFFLTVDQYLSLESTYVRTRDPATFMNDSERLRIYAVAFATPQEYDENDFSNEIRAAFEPLISALRTKVGRP